MMKGSAVIIVMSFFVLVGIVPIAQAADVINSGRIVQHAYKSEVEEAGDVPGHILVVVLNNGLIIFATGEIVPTMSANILDLVNGKGTITGRRVVTYPDGSSTYVEYVGTTTPVEGGKKSMSQGTYTCTGGTGRFAGRKGTGTFKAERLGSLKTGSDGYVDFSDNCK